MVFFSTVASVFVGKDFLAVVVDDAAHVRHAAVTDFHVVLIKDGCRLWFGGKFFLIRLRKVLATLVWKFFLLGGLNQMVFRFFFFFFVGVVVFFS